MRHTLNILKVMVVLLATIPALAATDSTGNSVSPTLTVNVTVNKSIRLTLSTGTQCAVNTGGGADFNMNLGAVDALGTSVPTCGSKFAPVTPGASSSAYYSDYKLTPVFASQSVSTNTLTAYVSTNFTKTALSLVQSNATPAIISDLTAMSTNAAAQTTIATNATSGTAITRYIGVAIAPTSGASATGADSATITYTLTAI